MTDKTAETITFALKGVTTEGDSNRHFGYYTNYDYNDLVVHSRRKWSRRYIRIKMCERGWHVVLPSQINEIFYNDLNTYLRTDQIWLVAVRGNRLIDAQKAVFGQMKFLSLIDKNTRYYSERGHRIAISADKLREKFADAVEKAKTNPKYYGLDEDSWIDD